VLLGRKDEESMRKSIDAKGLACPQPVIMCRKAIAEAGVDEIEIIVDNEAAWQNVLRFLRFTGSVEPVVASRGQVHAISAVVTSAMREKARGGSLAQAGDEESPLQPRLARKTIFLSSDQIGRGDEALGRLLMRGFLHTLGELDMPPRTLVFMNSGVRLAAEQEETIELLRAIEARGVEILVCGTCLDYLHLVDNLRVGRISNLYEITEQFLQTGDVVTVS
jgi:selenium metabolism protein YedF